MRSVSLIALIVIAFSVLVPVSIVEAGDPEFREFYFDMKNPAGGITPYELGIIEVAPGFFFVEIYDTATEQVICEDHLIPIDETRAFFSCGIGGGRSVTVFLEITIDGGLVYSVTLPRGTVLAGSLCPTN